MFNDTDPTLPADGYNNPQPTTPKPTITYEIVGQDPAGTTVYRGSDGNMYTDGQGLNGMVPYTGPGVGKAGPDTTTPPPTTAPAPSTGGNLTDPFTTPFTPPDQLNLGGPGGISYIPGTPTFTPPEFKAPTAEEALSDPGYQFRTQQGESALQNWAAARGTLNDSGTAKALIDYGQNAASQEYGNVWNRKFGEFGADYKGWQDATLGPAMQAYSTQAQAGEHQNDLNYANAWDRFLQNWNQFRDQRDSTFNKRFTVASA